MRAAIFNPYLDTLGGGERYTLSFAEVLVKNGFQVDLEWKNKEILDQLEKRFGLKSAGINIVSDVKRGDGYDLCFWVSDGSIPALKARKNFLHFQVPFHEVNGRSLINKMKLFRVNKIICNSNFTKKFIDAEYGVDSIVVYPPVDVGNIKPRRKENIILSVGRFSRLLQSKHQDILIKCFKQIHNAGYKDWEFILAGGSEVGDGGFTDDLLKISEGYPVEIVKNPNFKTLKELYGKSRIFWSASGFGEEENINPEKVEHFGISVVEAMAGGCVPIVYNAGGYKEIVINGNNGFLWNSEPELLKLTGKLLTEKSLLRQISQTSTLDSSKFSYNRFENAISSML